MQCPVCKVEGRNHLAGEHKGGMGRKREAALDRRLKDYEEMAKTSKAFSPEGYHKPGSGK